jgi:hypothetical protein
MLSAQLVHSWLKTLAANKEMLQIFSEHEEWNKNGKYQICLPFFSPTNA